MKYILILSLILIGYTTQAQSFFMFTAPPTSSIQGGFNLSLTAASAPGFTNLHGPFTSAQTVTDGNGVTLVNVTANWNTFGGSTGGNTTGVTTGSNNGTFTQAVGNNLAWTGNGTMIDTVNHIIDTASTNNGSCLRMFGLAVGNYHIILWGTLPSAFFSSSSTTRYGVQAGTGGFAYSYAFNPNFSPGTASAFNTWEVGPGTNFVNTGSFDITISTSGQIVCIFVGSGVIGTGAGTNYSAINGIFYQKF